MMMFIVALFGQDDTQLTILLLMCMLVIALIAHVRFQPFELDELDNLELLSLSASYITLFCGMFFTLGTVNADRSFKEFLTYIILIVNIITMGYFVKCFWMAAQYQAREAKRLLE